MPLPWVRLDTSFASNPKLLAMVAEKDGHRAGLVYLCSLGVLGGAAMALLLALGLPQDAGWPVTVAATLLALLPASEAIIALAHRLISEGARPLRLPRSTPAEIRDALVRGAAVQLVADNQGTERVGGVKPLSDGARRSFHGNRRES